jgi:hypothetical protein
MHSKFIFMGSSILIISLLFLTFLFESCLLCVIVILFFCDFIELTEKDEFSFHEMMTHLPLFSHPDPKSVLIVGVVDGVVPWYCRKCVVTTVWRKLAVSRKFPRMVGNIVLVNCIY